MPSANNILETPIYGMVDAAHYLRLPYQTLRYWTRGSDSVGPIVKLASDEPPRLSFVNLLECHMLSSMRKRYNLRLPKVRKALRTLAEMYPSPHPLLNTKFETNKIDVFIREYGNDLLNLNRPEQREFGAFLELFMERVEVIDNGMLRFFPFVEKRDSSEPKIIMMNPAVSFGRPVIAGTGIPTSVIASRFHARESIVDLAEEYGRSNQEIEEAIRWESRTAA